MDVSELRMRAATEAVELGSGPADPREREVWQMERHAAVVLLAELADRDAQVLRHAANGEWVHPAARNLLLDAAQECRGPSR